LRRLFQQLFFFFLLFGFSMATAYLWLLLQVWKSGRNLRIFSFTSNARMFSQYKKLVEEGRMPVWPLYLYWAAVIGSPFTALGMMATFNK